MRWSLALLVCCLLGLSGCHDAGVDEGSYSSYQVTVYTDAQPDALYAGMSTSLGSTYVVYNASITITDQDWMVTSAPAGYVLADYGREAIFTPGAAGVYVVRYRTWYYSNWDYDACYCSYATGYSESYVTVTVVAAPYG
jgi:hypothetical protein